MDIVVAISEAAVLGVIGVVAIIGIAFVIIAGATAFAHAEEREAHEPVEEPDGPAEESEAADPA